MLRRRTKVGSKDIVAHYRLTDPASNGAANRRLGLAVSKAVGTAVTRNHVKRRFRQLARMYEDHLPESCDVVLRAKPSAATADYNQLAAQIACTFRKIYAKTAARNS